MNLRKADREGRSWMQLSLIVPNSGYCLFCDTETSAKLWLHKLDSSGSGKRRVADPSVQSTALSGIRILVKSDSFIGMTLNFEVS
jgi:hypothetical protein